MKDRSWKKLVRADECAREWMRRNGIPLLRISLGIVYFWFGILKFFPGFSPAENLVHDTIELLTFDMVPVQVGIDVLAAWECVIGLGLLMGTCLRTVLILLWVQMIGAMSPIFLFPEQVFASVPFVPTLEGQYIIKNLVLISAAIVIGATLENPRREKIPPASGG